MDMLQGVTPDDALGVEGEGRLWAALCEPFEAMLATRGGNFVANLVHTSFLFAIAQSALMVMVGPSMDGGRTSRADASYVTVNMFKGAVLCAMAVQRHNWDMMAGIVSGQGAPDEQVVLWNAIVYAALDLSALVVNGAMRTRTVLHHTFVVAAATYIAELGADAAVSQAAVLYAFWSGTAACVNLVMAASKAAQVRGTRLPCSIFSMALGVYTIAFGCNMVSLALVVCRALAAGALPLHHGVLGAAAVCVWAYDDVALMRWLAKMAVERKSGDAPLK